MPEVLRGGTALLGHVYKGYLKDEISF